MKFFRRMEWPGNINEMTMDAVQELQRLEFDEDEAVAMILDAIRRVAPEDWNWKEEEKKVCHMWQDWLRKVAARSERSLDGRPVIKIKADNLSELHDCRRGGATDRGRSNLSTRRRAGANRHRRSGGIAQPKDKTCASCPS